MALSYSSRSIPDRILVALCEAVPWLLAIHMTKSALTICVGGVRFPNMVASISDMRE